MSGRPSTAPAKKRANALPRKTTPKPQLARMGAVLLALIVAMPSAGFAVTREDGVEDACERIERTIEDAGGDGLGDVTVGTSDGAGDGALAESEGDATGDGIEDAPAGAEGEASDDALGDDSADADGADDEGGDPAAHAAGRSIDMDDPSQKAILESHVVRGFDPESTRVNLFDYDTGRRSGEDVAGLGTIGSPNTAGTDTLGTTGTASAWRNYKVWLDDPDGINYGRLLTFGDGMRHMGYWNQGLVQNYGQFGLDNPGMQNIVSPLLVDGYPVLSDEVNPAGDPSWLRTGDYDAHTALYADATRVLPSGGTEQIYANAGNKNISNGVQYLSQNPGQVASAPANTDAGGGQDLSQAARSLAYLFDPDAASAGKVATHTDVKGLFQLDEEGYYYYNMRDNYAYYDSATNRFVLYDEPAGLRTDAPAGASDRAKVGNFFPFNSPADAFSIKDGQLVNAMSADNDTSKNSAPVNHHLGLTMETDFRQPVGGRVGSDPMTFEFIGDDDLWVFIDDVLVLDLGGIHSELFGTIDFSTGEVRLGTAFGNGGQVEDANTRIRTTIKDMFEVAGVDTSTGFTGSTFASNTSHTLKMYYLERGNYDSSLAMRFNLQPELYQQVKKVDQDGAPVKGATFDLYGVSATTAAGAEAATLDDVTYDEAAPLTTVTTDEEGIGRFMDGANPFNFADRVTDAPASQLYVLRETSAPPGYRLMPGPLLLRYSRETGTFIVNNRYETGSYASFNSYVTQISHERLTFGAYNAATGHIEATTTHVPLAQQAGGLVVAIPTIRQEGRDAVRWDPLYGSNNGGLDTISYDASDVNAMRKAMMEAVLYQAYLSATDGLIPGWYLYWNDIEERLISYRTEDGASGKRTTCSLSELPGNPTRYLLNDADGDMQMVYGIVSRDVFGSSGASLDASQKHALLADKVKRALGGVSDPSPDQLRAAVASVAGQINGSSTSGAPGVYGTRGFNAIDTSDGSQFERSFRTSINMPNDQRELRVWKVDQDGTRVNGAAFALFDSADDAARAVDADVADDIVRQVTAADGSVVSTVAAGVTGDLTGAQNKYQGDDLEGMLVFAPYVEDGVGGAHTEWTQGDDSRNGRVLYLKEVRAPTGFKANETLIPVVIGQYGIYADAGVEDDGVDVLAGVGKLNCTMSKYAASPHVNLTLRYIISTMQAQPSTSVPEGASSVPFDQFNQGWASDASKQMELIYGVNAIVDYGSFDPFTPEQVSQGIGYTDAEGNSRPLFRTSTGFIRTQVQQDTAAMRAAQAAGEYKGVNGDELAGEDLTNLFMIRNTVRVVDQRDPDAPPPDQPPPDEPGPDEEEPPGEVVPPSEDGTPPPLRFLRPLYGDPLAFTGDDAALIALLALAIAGIGLLGVILHRRRRGEAFAAAGAHRGAHGSTRLSPRSKGKRAGSRPSVRHGRSAPSGVAARSDERVRPARSGGMLRSVESDERACADRPTRRKPVRRRGR